ncbi:MAG: hypothetical protein V8R90_08910 [Eubacterium sp.]
MMYNREQLLCFLLTYDKAECLEFMEKLYHHMGWPTEKLSKSGICQSDKGERGMIARFLQDIVVNDIEKNMEMTIDKGEELFAIDRGTHYELRKADGWGTMAQRVQGRI